MLKFKKLPFNIDNTFIISDLHLEHLNICSATSNWESDRGCRNFNSLDEMNDLIISNINSQVKEDDLLIQLGDFTFQGKENIAKYRAKINCKNIIAIRGNHCQHISINNTYINSIGEELPCWIEISDLNYYQVDSIRFVVSHFPIWNWHEQKTGTLMIHGHLHSHEDEILKLIHEYRCFDAGIDNYFKIHKRYGVFSLKEINTILKNKKIIGRH